MHTPQSLRDSPCGHGERFPRTPSVASRFAHFSSNPQSLRDSPYGHGERFPRTPSVASLRIT